MRSARKILLGLGGLLVLWIGWGVYVTRTTERVPSETLDRFDGVEIRRYPQNGSRRNDGPGRADGVRRPLSLHLGCERKRRRRGHDRTGGGSRSLDSDDCARANGIRRRRRDDGVLFSRRRTRLRPPRRRPTPTFGSTSNRGGRSRCVGSRGTRRTSASTDNGAAPRVPLSTRSRGRGEPTLPSTTIRGRHRSCERTRSKSNSRPFRNEFVARLRDRCARSSNGRHWHRRPSCYGFGDASKQNPRDAGATVTSHNDMVDVIPVGVLEDRPSGLPCFDCGSLRTVVSRIPASSARVRA